jgi:asparagine synthase (glutamine-hydrolysing)
VCGVALIIDPPGLVEADAVASMVDAMSHRGPDAHGTHRAGDCTLGHARLRIIDLATGDQPLGSAEGDCWISYNGELYNYREIRGDLVRAGHAFRTSSDTEVLLAAWKQWGAGALDRFRGMFAFAIWNARERTLFAARDPFGEKPLYYATPNDQTLILASEIKGIVASKRITPSLDPQALDLYLALGHVPPDRTIYSNVHTLPPGHWLRWHDGELKITRYFSPRLSETRIPMQDAAEQLRALLSASVARQMVADAEVGVLLSGGIDSTIVVALGQRLRSHPPLKTFSVGFGDAEDELPYAREVAGIYATDHHELQIGKPPTASLLERIAAVYDEPFADSSQVPTFMIARHASEHVKVVLTGDGSDELFGGYTRHQRIFEAEELRFPTVQWVVFRLLERLFPAHRELARRANAAASASHQPDPWRRAIRSHVAMRAAQRSALWQAAVTDDLLTEQLPAPPPGTRGMNRAFHHDLSTYLPGDILVKVDRAAMAHGLETRAPFLDRDVVEFALSLDASLKVGRNAGKLVLRRAFEPELPQRIRSRPKQGFEAPIRRWLTQSDMQPLLDRVFAPGSALLRILPGAARERHAAGSSTWILLMLGLWLERYESHS